MPHLLKRGAQSLRYRFPRGQERVTLLRPPTEEACNRLDGRSKLLLEVRANLQMQKLVTQPRQQVIHDSARHGRRCFVTPGQDRGQSVDVVVVEVAPHDHVKQVPKPFLPCNSPSISLLDDCNGSGSLQKAVPQLAIMGFPCRDKEVYNGDIGFVQGVDLNEGELIASFNGRPVSYLFGELDTLVLAYAATIHKS